MEKLPTASRWSLVALLAAAALIGTAACSGDSPFSPSGTTVTGPGAPAGGTGGAGGAGGSGAAGGSGGSGDTSGSGNTGGSGGSDGTGLGRLAVNVTDSPFGDAFALLVTFTEVSVHRTGGGWETLDFADGGGSRTCDLKKLEGPVDVLGVGNLPAGKYTQIRLTVGSASIHFDNASVGETCAPAIAEPPGVRGTVEVPSGVVKLNRHFTVAADGQTTILLDFDGDKSIKQKGGPKNKLTSANDKEPKKPKENDKGCNGNSKKPGCSDGSEEGEDGAYEDGDTFTMKPVISVVHIDEDGTTPAE